MSRERPHPSDPPAPHVPPAGLRVLVLVTLWNRDVVDRLLASASARLDTLGVAYDVRDVPGAFELPLAASWAARSGGYGAVVALGCVIRGETAHFEHVAGNCARGLMDVGLATGVPCVFGVLTVETHRQALDRSGGSHGDSGRDAADAAVHMAALRASDADGV